METSKSSGFGIASFVLSLLAIGGVVAYWITTVVALKSGMEVDAFLEQNATSWGVVLFISMLFIFLGSILGLIFGILGARKQYEKKGLAIAGLVISAVLLVALIGFIIWATKVG